MTQPTPQATPFEATHGNAPADFNTQRIAFIGGGNMASAIIGGLRNQGLAAQQIMVVEPFEATRDQLLAQFGVNALAAADTTLSSADIVVWAVKPQSFKEAAQAASPFTKDALHLSVMAGIGSDALARNLQTEHIVRAMPNTPALIGQGMTGLFARQTVTPSQRQWVEALLSATGDLAWFDKESQLDGVTAISGSGPAYVFYFLEHLIKAGRGMGLTESQAKALALQTFAGATALAAQSPDSLSTLREKVTSKGGTTYAAITHLQNADVGERIAEAAQKACDRAKELGDIFGA